jgi:hypothetical protein
VRWKALISLGKLEASKNLAVLTGL